MSKNSSGGGIGLSSILLVTFIVLKLCKVIDWSWWWVLSPLWIGVAFVLVIFVGWHIFRLIYIAIRRK